MATKAITFMKQYFFMLALVATFIGFSAFKYVHKEELDDGYYSLSYLDEQATNLNHPSNLKIESFEGASPGEDCDVNNPQEIACAVYLEFDGTTEMPETVELADLDGTIDVGDTAWREETP